MQSTRGEDEATLAMDSLRRLVHGVRVSGAQRFVLSEIAAAPGVSIRRLSERTSTDPSSVSVVVDRLVEQALEPMGRRAPARRGEPTQEVRSNRGKR